MANKKKGAKAPHRVAQQLSTKGKTGLAGMASYAAVAVLFAAIFAVFFMTLSTMESKWKVEADHHLDSYPPRLEFQPKPDWPSVRISFQVGNETSWSYFSERMRNFMDPYEPGRQFGSNVFPCQFGTPLRDGDNVCFVDVRIFGDNCTRENYFGYGSGMPCVALMMNKVVDWTPVTYNKDDLPADIPAHLKNRITNADDPDHRFVWVTCDGENPTDSENMGPHSYHGYGQGFPSYYFPYRNQSNYRSPLVMVQFLRPAKGVGINIECRAWAHNIAYNRSQCLGNTRFELFIED